MNKDIHKYMWKLCAMQEGESENANVSFTDDRYARLFLDKIAIDLIMDLNVFMVR